MANGVRAGEVLAILRAQNEMKPAIREATEDVRGLGGHIATAAATMGGFVGGTAIMGAVSSAFSVAKNAAFGMNSTLETTTLQFHSLGMSTADAQSHVQDLFKFAKDTPFETGPIIEASRQLRVFGGANLDTISNLRLFGDTAAATNADLGALTFWFGRLYSAAQAGKPFGEALQNLQQLGVLSPQAVTQLSNMSEHGAKFADVWKVATGDLQRFNGAMKDQAGTWKGLTSTISDAINITGAQVLQPFFKMAEQGAGRLADALGSDRVASAATRLSKQIGDTLSQAAKIGGDAVTTFQQVMRDTGSPIDAVAGSLGLVAERLGVPAPVAQGLSTILDDLAKVLQTVSTIGRGVLLESLTTLLPPLSRLAKTVADEVLPPLDDLILKVTDWITGAGNGAAAANTAAGAIDAMTGPVKALGAGIEFLNDHFDQIKVVLAGALVVWGAWKAVMLVTTTVAWLQTAGIYAYVAATYAMRAAQLVATVAQWAWNVAMTANPIGLIIVGVGLLVAGLVLLATHWNQVTDALGAAWHWLGQVYESNGLVHAALSGIVEPIKAVVQHWGEITAALGGAWAATVKFGGGVGQMVGSVAGSIGQMVNLWNNLPGMVWNAVASIPGILWNVGVQAAGNLASALQHIHIPSPHFNVDWHFVGVGDVGVSLPSISFGGWYQQGAIFTKPTMIGVGENGPEGVFPLPKGYNPATAAAAMGLVSETAGAGTVNDHLLGAAVGGRRRTGPVSITIYVNGAQDPAATGREIESKLRDLFRP